MSLFSNGSSYSTVVTWAYGPNFRLADQEKDDQDGENSTFSRFSPLRVAYFRTILRYQCCIPKCAIQKHLTSFNTRIGRLVVYLGGGAITNQALGSIPSPGAENSPKNR